MRLTKFTMGVALALMALAGVANAQDKGTIGIAMPTKSSARWIADGDNMVKVLQAKGYKTDLQYADNDIPNQLAQVENMITKKEKVLVIAAIDGTTLSDALQHAADAGIKVISYDRLIRGSANVDYYATFDNFQVGVLQAGSIEKGLGLKEGKGPFNIELFGGSADDNNAFFFYDGAMSVLKPYIDSGKLVVRSKQMGMDKVSTLRWEASVAQARMENLLSAFYTKDRAARRLRAGDPEATPGAKLLHEGIPTLLAPEPRSSTDSQPKPDLDGKSLAILDVVFPVCTAPSAKTAPSRDSSSWPASPTSAPACWARPPAWTRT